MSESTALIISATSYVLQEMSVKCFNPVTASYLVMLKGNLAPVQR
jgi:hypothetical protein